MASNNNSSTGAMERSSSIRMCKQSGGGSTMGSIIFGGSSETDKTYVEDRKSRRLYHQGATPEQSVLPTQKSTAAADASMYGAPTSAQRERERITVAPGAVTPENLRQLQQQQHSYPQHHHSRNPIYDDSNNNNSDQQQLVTRRSSTSDYFANGLGNTDAGNQQRRTRRMVAPPGSRSNFQLG